MQLLGGKGRAPLAGVFSIRQAKRLMAAVPQGEAQAISHARNHIVHHAGDRIEVINRVHHPLVEGCGEQRAALVRALARCAPGTSFAEVCSEVAERLRAFDSADALADGQEERLRAHGFLLAGEIMRFVLQVWAVADRIDEFQAAQEALCSGSPRVARVLREARIPLWVVSVLSRAGDGDPRAMTAEDLLELADLNDANCVRRSERSRDAWLAEAETALGLLRSLAVLDVKPAAWNDLLESLAARLDAAARPEASRVEEVMVPPRPCHPPGELVMAEPRIPRAPGCAAPRRSVDKGRGRLHRCGGRGGRPTV